MDCAYDANGDVTAETNTNGTTQFGWDFENRLTQAVVPGTNAGGPAFRVLCEGRGYSFNRSVK